jgi:small-conductance mechanosensitive channel
LFARPFKRGDVIKTKIGGQEFYGKVVSVDIRYLKIQNYDKDGGVQILPLASIYNAPITVLSSE